MAQLRATFLCLLILAALPSTGASAQSPDGIDASIPSSSAASSTDWHYGAYLDMSYIVNFNFPENHLWRSRSTASWHNEFAPNMVLAYARKDASESSPWGMELGLQGGYDSQDFAVLF